MIDPETRLRLRSALNAALARFPADLGRFLETVDGAVVGGHRFTVTADHGCPAIRLERVFPCSRRSNKGDR